MAKIRVLVAGRQNLFYEGIRALLRCREDIEVIACASSGKEVLENVNKKLPDVVLMDATRPVMNCFEVIRQLRRGNKTTKILLLIHHDDKEYMLNGFRAGANGFVSDRATCSDLISAILTISRSDYFRYPSVAITLVHNYLQGITLSLSQHPALCK